MFPVTSPFATSRYRLRYGEGLVGRWVAWMVGGAVLGLGGLLAANRALATDKVGVDMVASTADTDKADAEYWIDPHAISVPELLELGAGVPHRGPGGLIVVATPAQREAIEARIGASLLPVGPPQISGDVESPPASPKAEEERFTGHGALIEELRRLAGLRPDVATYEEWGRSREGRLIAAVRVRWPDAEVTVARSGPTRRDVPSVVPGRPRVRLAGCHHGNEWMSVEIPLMYLRRLLLDDDGDDPVLRRIRRELELLVVPMVNPDGHVRRKRENALDVDLNRNYAFQWFPSTRHGSRPFSEPEVRVVAADQWTHAYAVGLSYHTYGDYVNSVWNYSPIRPLDREVVAEMSRVYATPTGYEAVFGYDWYQTFGDLNDFSYGGLGTLDWTIEMADADIEGVYVKNRTAIDATLLRSIQGVGGRVVDAQGQGLRARVEIHGPQGRLWPVFTNAKGDWHRPAAVGAPYWIRIWPWGGAEPVDEGPFGVEPGLRTVMVSQVPEMPPLPGSGQDESPRGRSGRPSYGFQVWGVRGDPEEPSLPHDTLGPPDGRVYRLAKQRNRPGRIAVALPAPIGDTGFRLTVWGQAPTLAPPEQSRVSVLLTGDPFATGSAVGSVELGRGAGSVVSLDVPAVPPDAEGRVFVTLIGPADADGVAYSPVDIDAVALIAVGGDGGGDEDADGDLDGEEAIGEDGDAENDNIIDNISHDIEEIFDRDDPSLGEDEQGGADGEEFGEVVVPDTPADGVHDELGEAWENDASGNDLEFPNDFPETDGKVSPPSRGVRRGGCAGGTLPPTGWGVSLGWLALGLMGVMARRVVAFRWRPWRAGRERASGWEMLWQGGP